MKPQFKGLRTFGTATGLAALIALTLGVATPAQAQYHDPAAASSSGGHMANGTHPVRARGENPAAYGHSSNPLRNRNLNPSMQSGEACPIGSACGPHTPTGAGPAGSARYGSGAGYGQAQAPSQANGIHPIRAQVGDQRNQLPARLGGINPALGQTRNNVGNHAPTSSSYGTSNYKIGQLGSNGQSFTNGHGQKVTLGGAQSFTGPTGKKTTLGGSQSLTGSHSIGGETYGTQGNVNAQGDHTSGLHMNNGGAQGVADAPPPLKNFDDSHHYDASTHQMVSNTDNFHKAAPGALDAVESGLDQLTGSDSKKSDESKSATSGAEQFKKQKEGGGVGDDPDIGPQRGSPEGLMGANGQRKSPGKRPGDDAPGGANPDGTGTSGGSGKNAGTGTYVKATNKNGQDVPVKPKPTGALDATKLQNGASDPKRTGGDN